MVVRLWYYIISILVFVFIIGISFVWEPIWWFMLIIGPLFLLGIYDILQPNLNVLRNYPVWGHWRFLLLKIRPQIQQYFINTDQSGRPFNKEMRDLVYDRAQKTEDNIPFGTELDVHEVGYEWVNHSMTPTAPDIHSVRVVVGGPQCILPYSSSRFNISALSFGAISPEAIRALNRGAKLGNFAHDTGEGGISKYHLMEGGDIIWELGSAYFGARDQEGHFDPKKFAEKANLDNVKMIEIKLSQGAKPGHGAILPGAKVTAEIAETRGIPIGKDCLSPARHSAFSTPIELMEFIKTLRELSGGKPIGFKLCIGIRSQFMAVCKAMLETGIYPDFIVIDGSEGGTGAAPVEFLDSIGTPLNEGLIFAHNCLVGVDLRKHVRLIGSGKIISGFDIATKIALGADICNSARGMMFALGCIQSLRCHTNQCPTGVTTQDPHRRYALNIDVKAPYVRNFHDATLKSFLQVLGAVGLMRPEDLHPTHIHRRVSKDKALTYDEIFDFLSPGQLLEGTAGEEYMNYWHQARANSFDSILGNTHRARSET
ncbi:MAG: glutamate synthase [Coxiella sp. RIFCSPHIGHO2_12_FULL_42_15]|nr:MAG: glutamate synthase [Coxiella sp. RIFCSPHIGHO2_12_FULL_42_15]